MITEEANAWDACKRVNQEVDDLRKRSTAPGRKVCRELSLEVPDRQVREKFRSARNTHSYITRQGDF